jgi:hypothetical protein
LLLAAFEVFPQRRRKPRPARSARIRLAACSAELGHAQLKACHGRDRNPRLTGRACAGHAPYGKDRRAITALFATPGSCVCCRSSVVEHSLGKGEVVSSILTGSTRTRTDDTLIRLLLIGCLRFVGRHSPCCAAASRMGNLNCRADVFDREEIWSNAMKRTIICAFGLAVLATPALAEDYWVVRDSSTKHCSIVTEKPTTTTTTVIGTTAFKTRTEAESSMKTTKVCSSD